MARLPRSVRLWLKVAQRVSQQAFHSTPSLPRWYLVLPSLGSSLAFSYCFMAGLAESSKPACVYLLKKKLIAQ